MKLIHKTRAYVSHRPLYLLRGLCSIIDGIILIASLGFLGGSFEIRVCEYQIILAGKKARADRLLKAKKL